VQYREVQGFESVGFLAYFPQFVTLRGGVATGFHHVHAAPPPDVHKLYRISVAQGSTRAGHAVPLVVREVLCAAASLVEGDVFVLDRGAAVWQLNTTASAGKEKFRAAEFVQSIVSNREGACAATVFDEGGPGVGTFLSALGAEALPARPTTHTQRLSGALTLFRFSDASGSAELTKISPVARASLSSDDAFLLDATSSADHPAVYVWVGRGASLVERRMVLQYAQDYLHGRNQRAGAQDTRVSVGTAIVVMREGDESEEFFHVLGSA